MAAPAQTEGEVAAARNAKMDDSLGRFDEMIRNEREQIARERDARGGAGGSGDGDGDAGAGGSGDGTNGAGEGGEGSEDGPLTSDQQKAEAEQKARSGDMKSDKQAAGGTGAAGSGGGGPATGPIPDGSDDDIIARQIREAAEKETDPELKEKLWKEYIEYKKNAQKK